MSFSAFMETWRKDNHCAQPRFPEIDYISLEQVIVMSDEELTSRAEAWWAALEIDLGVVDAPLGSEYCFGVKTPTDHRSAGVLLFSNT